MFIENLIMLIFIQAFIAIGSIFAFRIARFPDLTIDGSFALGGSVAAICIVNGYPFTALICSLFAGAGAGLATAALHNYCKVNRMLSGIIVMTSLYSVNIRIMNGANIQFLHARTVFNFFETWGIWAEVGFVTFVFALVVVTMLLMLHTVGGLFFRAGAQNADLIQLSGRNAFLLKCSGPICTNAVVALGGGLTADFQGFSDVNMGFGILINGLAYVLLSSAIMRNVDPVPVVLSSLLGVVLYQVIFQIVLRAGARPSDLKLLTAAMVLFAAAFLARGKHDSSADLF
jgi:putative ABC transport system permease protein